MHGETVIDDMPLSIFKKYGITQKDLEKIEKNTEEYEGSIGINGDLVSIYNGE